MDKKIQGIDLADPVISGIIEQSTKSDSRLYASRLFRLDKPEESLALENSIPGTAKALLNALNELLLHHEGDKELSTDNDAIIRRLAWKSNSTTLGIGRTSSEALTIVHGEKLTLSNCVDWLASPSAATLPAASSAIRLTSADIEKLVDDGLTKVVVSNEQIDALRAFATHNTLTELGQRFIGSHASHTSTALIMESDAALLYAKSVPFYTNYVLALIASKNHNYTSLSTHARDIADNIVRHQIGLILESGIITDTSLPENDRAWQAVVNELEAVGQQELLPLLEIGGFANQTLGDQGSMEDGDMVLRCQECIYYLPKRKWCDLPALPLPVEAHWYCRLWKL